MIIFYGRILLLFESQSLNLKCRASHIDHSVHIWAYSWNFDTRDWSIKIWVYNNNFMLRIIKMNNNNKKIEHNLCQPFSTTVKACFAISFIYMIPGSNMNHIEWFPAFRQFLTLKTFFLEHVKWRLTFQQYNWFISSLCYNTWFSKVILPQSTFEESLCAASSENCWLSQVW